MLQFDFIATKSRILPLADIELGLAAALELVFSAWISAAAALTFLTALVLALFRIMSWTQLLYVYAGITGVTLLLAFLLYLSRREH
ncbi:MAG: hypothetical protein WBP94_15320 [Rhodomicrobiaceae bacterium]